MSVSSINSLSGFSLVANLAKSSQTSDTGDVDKTSGFSVQMSQMGQLMSELSALAQSDPTKFKQVAAQIAQQLSDAASSQDGNSADSLLSKLADRFSKAAQSGDASDLTPQAGQGAHHAGGHHGHRHYVEANGAADSTQNQTDNRAATLATIEGIISQALQGAKATP